MKKLFAVLCLFMAFVAPTTFADDGEDCGPGTCEEAGE